MAKAENKSIEHTGPDVEPVGTPWDDQERAADSTKDVKSVKQVADPTNEGGLPKWEAPSDD